MGPHEAIEKALRKDMRIRPQERAVAALKAGQPIPLSGREAWEAAQIVLDELAGAGFSVVSTGDLRAYLYRGKDLKSEVEAMNRLREIAGPERSQP
jgi:hypothetical protein